MRKAVHLFGKAFRETGQALDRLGLKVLENDIYRDTFSRHRPILSLFDKKPAVDNSVFVAPNASVIGNVILSENVSVWYGAVIRGDRQSVKIGYQTNVQDRAVISTVNELENGFPAHVEIGKNVTIGHGAILTSCIVKNHTLIGQGAIIGAGAEIGRNTIIAAGAVVLPDTIVPDRQLWAGNPAKFIREVTEEEEAFLLKSAESYSELRKEHSDEFLPFGTIYQEAEKHEK